MSDAVLIALTKMTRLWTIEMLLNDDIQQPRQLSLETGPSVVDLNESIRTVGRTRLDDDITWLVQMQACNDVVKYSFGH